MSVVGWNSVFPKESYRIRQFCYHKPPYVGLNSFLYFPRADSMPATEIIQNLFF